MILWQQQRNFHLAHGAVWLTATRNEYMMKKTQKWKNKRIYESFTDDDPSPAGRKRAELAAAQFQASKTPDKIRKRQDYGKLTLSQAIDKYIESRENLNRSPTTLQDYRCIQKNAFPDLMDTPIKDIDITILRKL